MMADVRWLMAFSFIAKTSKNTEHTEIFNKNLKNTISVLKCYAALTI